MPVDWVDGVTWVNAANLEIMEADIAAKQPTSDKGAANGYAPLDAASKVPLVNLPPVSGVDYIGDWGAGIAYKKGDVVRYGGKDYMAVNDSTGVTPPAAASVPLYSPGYATTLPASPVHGEEAILVDSTSNPTYQWRFRYNAGSSSAYKWEFIGGPYKYIESTTDDAESNASVGNLPGGPSFTVPRAGDWLISIDGLASGPVQDAQLFICVGDAAVPASTVITRGWSQPTVAGRWTMSHAEGRAPGVGSGVVLTAKAWHTGGGSSTWTNRRLCILPVRVA